MKIVILNQYCENRGDEAAGEALAENLLGLPAVDRIDIIYNSAYRLNIEDPRLFHRNQDLLLKKIGVRAIGKYLALRKTPFKKFAVSNETLGQMIRTLREADYIFITPCGASIGIYKDWPFLVRILFAVLEGKTPIFYLDTIGRSHDLVFDHIARYVLKKSIIYVREKASHDYLESIGIPSKTGVDTAFSRKPVYLENRPGSIGLVVTRLDWHPDFRGTDINSKILDGIIPGIAQFCSQNGLSIDLIPHIGNQDELEFMAQIASALQNSGLSGQSVHICQQIKTAAEYDNKIASERLVVGMRYHSIVLAAKNAVPFLSIAYENKMVEACRYTGFPENCLNLHDPISANDITHSLDRIYQDLAKISSKLKERYPVLHNLALLPLERFASSHG